MDTFRRLYQETRYWAVSKALKLLRSQWRDRKSFIFLPKLQTINFSHRALSISPHPDDDILAIGGILAGNVKSGGNVYSIVVTDGARGTFDTKIDNRLIETRMKETREAAEIIGIQSINFWQKPDGAFRADPENCSSMAKIITNFSPDYVYVPFPIDYHWDHIESTLMVINALDLINASIPIRCYECIIPIIPNMIFDVTSVIHQKINAVSCFCSQNQVNNYVNTVVNGLNRHRSHGLLSGEGYGEAIFETDKKFLKTFCEILM